MTHIINNYDFELDSKFNIHICETRNNKRKYLDMIAATNTLTKDEFIYKCKQWYAKNVLFI